ncbi:MAG: hypothetical protein KGI26_07120 [Thaumarchaeota archaeon]|nr:hypothetical protein [Nitrososphaerota archaeon]
MAFARAYRFARGASSEDVKRELASANPGSLVQVVRAGSLDNELLAEMLAAQTLRAEEADYMLAKKAEIDLLLRLAGTTQISEAIAKQGAVKGEGFVAINAGRKELSVPDGFRGAELPRKSFTHLEFSRIERAALLNAQRG